MKCSNIIHYAYYVTADCVLFSNTIDYAYCVTADCVFSPKTSRDQPYFDVSSCHSLWPLVDQHCIPRWLHHRPARWWLHSRCFLIRYLRALISCPSCCHQRASLAIIQCHMSLSHKTTQKQSYTPHCYLKPVFFSAGDLSLEYGSVWQVVAGDTRVTTR